MMSSLDKPLQQFIDLVPMACCALDEQLFIIHLNEGMSTLLGKKKSELLDTDFHQLFSATDAKAMDVFLASTTEIGDKSSREFLSKNANLNIRLRVSVYESTIVVFFEQLLGGQQNERIIEENEKDFEIKVEEQVAERTNEITRNQSLLRAAIDSSFSYLQVFEAVRNDDKQIVDFTWRTVNRTFAERYGDMTGRRLIETNPGVVETGILEAMISVVETGETRSQEHYYRFEQFDGWFYQVLVKLDDGLVITTDDITARKLIEAQLSASEERLRLFVTSSSDLIYKMNSDWTIMHQLTGKDFLEDTDLPNKEWLDMYIPVDEQSRVLHHIEEAVNGKHVFELEHKVISSTNDIGWAHSRAIPITDKSGNLLEWFGTARDITARKQAEKDLLKNYTLLQQSEQLAVGGTWDFQLHHKLLTWSEGMYDLFNIKRGTVVTPSVYAKYCTYSSLETGAKVVEQLYSGLGDFQETLEILVGNETKVLQLKGVVLKAEDAEPVRVLGVALDVTAIRNAERTIHDLKAQQQQAIFRTSLHTQEEERRRISESLHNSLGQLLYGVKMAVETLKVDVGAPIPKKFNDTHKYACQLLTQAIKECRSLSHQLVPTVLTEFGLDAAIKDSCSQIKSNTRFRCVVNLGAEVKLDSFMQLAVFRTAQELILNVNKHAEASAAAVTITSQDEEVIINVSDNGKGIDTTQLESPGIGISSIRKNAQLLKGNISIISSPQNGTQVIVTLPWA